MDENKGKEKPLLSKTCSQTLPEEILESRSGDPVAALRSESGPHSGKFSYVPKIIALEPRGADLRSELLASLNSEAGAPRWPVVPVAENRVCEAPLSSQGTQMPSMYANC